MFSVAQQLVLVGKTALRQFTHISTAENGLLYTQYFRKILKWGSDNILKSFYKSSQYVTHSLNIISFCEKLITNCVNMYIVLM